MKPDWSIEIENGCAQALFGHGVVLIARCINSETQKYNSLIIHSVQEGDPNLEAGQLYENSPYINKPETDLPKPYIKLVFDNVEGVEALLIELNLLREQIKADNDKDND